jgi:DNA-binding beta-propeller fold protein YncE
LSDVKRTFSLRAALACVAAFGASRVVAQPTAANPRGTIITANMNAASASMVDIATGATLATDTMPVGPHEVAVSNDGRWAVVSWYGVGQTVGNALYVFDVTGAEKPRRIDLGTYTRPHGMKFLPGDKQIVVTSETTQRLLMVDFATGAIDSAITTGFPASHMVVITPDARWAFTTNITPGTVSRIDLRAKKLDTSFTIGTRVEGIAITPDGREIWLGGNTSKTVYILDAATGAVRGTIEGFGMPYRLGVTADGKTAVVSDPGAEKIHLVDVATRAIRSTLDMSTVIEGMPRPSPQGVIVSRDGATAFVTLKGAGKVAVVDIASAKVLKLLTVGGGSDGVGFSPVVRTNR